MATRSLQTFALLVEAVEVVAFLEGMLDPLVLMVERLQLGDELRSGLVRKGHLVPPFLAREHGACRIKRGGQPL